MPGRICSTYDWGGWFSLAIFGWTIDWFCGFSLATSRVNVGWINGLKNELMDLQVWGLFFLDICSEDLILLFCVQQNFMSPSQFSCNRNRSSNRITRRGSLPGTNNMLYNDKHFVHLLYLLLFLLLFLCIFHLQCIAKNNF